MAFLCVSVDLDEIYCYNNIHGLSQKPDKSAANVVYQKALPRVLSFFEENRITGTLFVVGKDLENNDSASLIAEAAKKGHEIGNHTASHYYDFSKLSSDDQAKEIDNAASAIAKVTGIFPKGFRAPGYNLNMGIVTLLIDRGYEYDSSVFPCPAYYAAKAAAIGIKGISGKISKSIMGDPRILTAPTVPYRIGEQGVWTRSDNGLKELPVATVTKTRLPFIGTSVAASGTIGAKMLALAASKLPVVSFELHGMDFIDADKDGISYLKSHQTDLRIAQKKRVGAINTAIKTLLDKGMEPCSLLEAAQRVFI